MRTSKQQQLDDLAQQIIRDDPCPDLSAQATQLVMGGGNPNADIVFIGEAPGKKEDQTGEPFVGASGKMLDEMLQSIHLKRSLIYITNIVKYRPPNNRDPLTSEKRAFTPYLESQLEVINPKLVVTLGRHSGEYFLPDLKISQDHGEPRQIEWPLAQAHNNQIEAHSTSDQTLMVLPLYHPAAALYNGSLRETLRHDFAKILTVINEISTNKI